jgi:DHA1 family multidrug resistance protein-like MFS transporter
MNKLLRRNVDKKEPRPSWQRMLVIVWIAEFVALIGFAMVMPFLPFYVQDLGVTDEAQVKFWSGLLLSSQAVTMAIFAPIWGSLADRYGRKLMLERAMFGAAVIVTLMGFARTPQQLLLLRAVQGCLTGTVPAATTLIASVVPKERTGFALGWLQMGVFAGISVGPLVGGVIADSMGYRASFFLTGACLFLAGMGVLFFVHEEFERPEPGAQRSSWWGGLAEVLRSRDVLTVLGLRLMTRSGARFIAPVLPLFVAAMLPSESRVATITGLVTGVSAASSSIGAVLLGQAGDRVGYRRILLASSLAAALFYALQALATSVAQLIFLQVCVGAALAGTISSLTALLATLAPQGQQGAVYGADTSVVAGANALAPTIGAAFAVAWGDRAAFLLAAGVFTLAALVVAWLSPQLRPGASPRPVDKGCPADKGCSPAKSCPAAKA